MEILLPPGAALFPAGFDPNSTASTPRAQAISQSSIAWHQARIIQRDVLIVKLLRSGKSNIQSVIDDLKHQRRQSELALGIDDDDEW